jgi:glycerol-3-phosphate dehydrogenase
MKREFHQLAASTYDVLIIGGGIYGACAAWDAALRGLSVALLEKGDFGQATSSNTLRVIHGGLRYLQHGDLGRLRHSIQERTAFMRIAPHLVHPLPFVIPTYGHALRGREALFMALLINNVIGFDRNRLQDCQKYLPSGRIIRKKEFLRLFPGVEETGLTGGAIVYDCQMFSSERLVLSFVRSAVGAGARVANYAEVFELLSKGDRVLGVKARNLLNGCEVEIRAKVVVNTTGPWLDRVLSQGDSRSPTRNTAFSKAFNILINRQLIPRYALGIYTRTRFKDRDALLSKGSRLLFLAPWHNRTLLGTVHLPYDCDPDQCRVTEEEIQSFLNEVNDAYPTAQLVRQDVCFTYGGLLPMGSHAQGGVQLVKHYRIRDHKKDDGVDGLISVMGVKFTEARHVAEKTVDLLVAKLGAMSRKSQTTMTPLYGGKIEQFSTFLAEEFRKKPQHVSRDAFQSLLYLYGSAYPEVLKYIDSDFYPCQSDHRVSIFKGQPKPSAEGCSDLSDEFRSGDSSLLRAEVFHGIREEMAQKLTDVVFRRTSLSLPGNQKNEFVGMAAALMAKELDWDDVRTQRELSEVETVLSASNVS